MLTYMPSAEISLFALKNCLIVHVQVLLNTSVSDGCSMQQHQYAKEKRNTKQSQL